MAVIKPFSKTSEERYSGGGDLPPHVPLPSLPSMSSLPTHPDAGTDKTLYDLSEAEERYSITYRPQTPSPISTVSQRLGAGVGEDPQMTNIPKYPSSICSGGSGSSCGPPSSGSAVTGSDGRLVVVDDHPGQAQSSLMDQISCVVNRFTANITELNSMMLSSSPSHSHTHKHTPPSPHHNDPYLLPRELQMPPTLTTYADVQPLPPVESGMGSRGGCLVHPIPPSPYPLPAPHLQTSPSLSPMRGGLVNCQPDSPLRRAELEEELIALTPPSPFRDSLASSSGSPVSETGLYLPPVPSHPPPSPPSPGYSRLALRNYSQSSSSL